MCLKDCHLDRTKPGTQTSAGFNSILVEMSSVQVFGKNSRCLGIRICSTTFVCGNHSVQPIDALPYESIG